jgi:hypothetical protein
MTDGNMALTNAERQRRWRARHAPQALAHLRQLKLAHPMWKRRIAPHRVPASKQCWRIELLEFEPSNVVGISTPAINDEANKGSGSSFPNTATAKHESGKPSGSQIAHGTEGIIECICDDPRFPGKPLRILRLY